MTGKPENPPAFPVAWHVPNAPEPGMTLRDYFAAAAMTGFNASFGCLKWTASQTAENAYRHADAMLKTRQS